MEFEWDESKSQLNLQKHGRRLEEAEVLWRLPDNRIVEARVSGQNDGL